MLYFFLKYSFLLIALLKKFNCLNIETSKQTEIILKNEKDSEYEIYPNEIYKFVIESEKYVYHFENRTDIFYTYDKNNTLTKVIDNFFFRKGEIIYANYPSNLKNSIKIKITSILNNYKINSIETLTKNLQRSFVVEEESYLYYDALDNNCKIKISEFNESGYTKKENILNKIIKIYPNITYILDFEVYDISTIKEYIHPCSSNQENDFSEYDIFIHLNEEQRKIIDFKYFKKSKMIRLSDKTLDAKVTIYDNSRHEVKTLDIYNKYYIVPDTYKEKLTLKNGKEFAFLEFLTKENSTIIENITLDNYQLEQNSINIKLTPNQKSLKIKINSDNIIEYSLSFSISEEDNYYFQSLQIINSTKKEVILQYLAPFKYSNDFDLKFLYISLYFQKKEDTHINISYCLFSEIDDIFGKKLSHDFLSSLKSYLYDLFDLYVYYDIAKNPPPIKNYPKYHHERVDLKKEIENWIEAFFEYPEYFEIYGFYELYQFIQIRFVFAQDIHLEFICEKIDSFIYFNHFYYLPFNLEIREYEGKKRIFIKQNNYINEFDSNIQNIIKSHLNIPLYSINDIDPFDYIQNWGYFRSTKNPHAQFTRNIDVVSKFYLNEYPLFYWNITLNDYEFEDGTNLRLSYKLGKKFNDINNNKINENDNNALPQKDLNSKEKVSKTGIEWKIEYINGNNFFKCRVDEINKVNVLIQNSFSVNGGKYGEAKIKIIQCAKLFHSNSYPIIIIESKNNGGNPNLALLMIQLFQMRAVERQYESLRLSDTAKKFYKGKTFSYLNPKTCNYIRSYEDFEEEIDNYNYNGLNIEHKRTKPFLSGFGIEERDAINNFRREYQNSKNLKRPTDIIIFTDSYSFSAASTLITGFQNIGGAIIVGYFGNPKIEGTDMFDGSQSNSGVKRLDDYEIENMRFEVSFTETETFNDFYKKGNPIPKEYELNPVDIRVDIYSKYSDEIYNDFITEGLKIHKKFNDEGYCNSNNTKLIYHDDNNCDNIDGKDNAHGGYKCGEDNKWNKTKCHPYYCDIGYYYDQYEEKCIEECKSEYKAFYIHDSISKKYTINPNEYYRFYFENLDYSYAIQSTEDNLYINFNKAPKINFVNGLDTIVYNTDIYEKKDINVTINSFKSDISFKTLKDSKLPFEDFIKVKGKQIIIIQQSNDSIFSINGIKSNKISFIKYTNEMNYIDIINAKNFKVYSNELLPLEKNEIYIFYFNFNDKEDAFFEYSINPNSSETKIEIKNDNKQNFIYLEKGQTYNLDFKNVEKNAMIKLSKKSLNSKININNINENIQINSTNYYYEIKNNNSSLQLEVTQENAFLEILYKDNSGNEEEFLYLDLEKNNFKLTKKYNLITIPKNDSLGAISFEIISKEDSNYTISKGYSVNNYCHFPYLEEKDLIQLKNYKFKVVEPYKDKDEYMNDEFYTINIIILKGEISLDIQFGYNDNSKVFPVWAIILIVIGSIAIIVCLFIFIRYCKRKKLNVTDLYQPINL